MSFQYCVNDSRGEPTPWRTLKRSCELYRDHRGAATWAVFFDGYGPRPFKATCVVTIVSRHFNLREARIDLERRRP